MTKQKLLLKGIGASPGKIKGEIKIIKFPEEISEIEKNQVLVLDYLTPEFLPFVKRISQKVGIITNKGGATCHAAILVREHKIPLIVGTKYATRKLKSGMNVIFDGVTGNIYENI